MSLSRSPARCCDEYDEYRQQRSRMLSRRDFLKTTIGAMAAAPIAPHLLLSSRLAAHANPTGNGTILVVIQLGGGNDGLNTIVPYGSGLYYQDRPNIAVPAKSVLPIDDTVGFNPNLKGMKALYDQGKVAIVQGAGYPNPNRSHFQSTTIWETADPTLQQTTGWLGRYLDAALQGEHNPLVAVSLGPMLPQTMLARQTPVTAIQNIASYRFMLSPRNRPALMAAYESMMAPGAASASPYINVMRSAGQTANTSVQDLATVATGYKPSITYPRDPLSAQLQLVSQLIAANLGTRVFHVTLGGFDDHAAEVFTHAHLMTVLGDSVNTFMQDLTAQGKADQVLIMTFSEFGRRVAENAGRGTDHGTAAPIFVIGNRVKGGMLGTDPILDKLDDNGDLTYGIDFRSVYGTVLDRWLGASSRQILGGSYESLPFL